MKKVLFIDIETVSLEKEYANLNKDLQKAWAKKAEYFQKSKENEEQTVEEIFKEKAAIFSEFGKSLSLEWVY